MISSDIDMPVTRSIHQQFERSIHQQFERSMTATVKASDFGWDAGIWATHFYVVGREGCFNLFSDIRRSGVLTAKVYRDSMGFEIIVDNQ